jgi:hypothetical protein
VPDEALLLICIAPFSAPMRSRRPIRPLVSSRASVPIPIIADLDRVPGVFDRHPQPGGAGLRVHDHVVSASEQKR